MTDKYFVIPLLYVLITLILTITTYIPFLKQMSRVKGSTINIIVMAALSLMITIKDSIAFGISFITSAAFSFIEEFVFGIFYNN